MNLDRFSIPKEVFEIINSIDPYEEQDKLIRAVMHYIYNDDDYYATALHHYRALDAFSKIRELLEKPLIRARKAKARRDDRKAHPEKYPPRRRKAGRKAGAVELPSGHVIESETPEFDYYCIKDDKIMYFRIIGHGEVNASTASFNSTFNPDRVLHRLLGSRRLPGARNYSL